MIPGARPGVSSTDSGQLEPHRIAAGPELANLQLPSQRRGQVMESLELAAKQRVFSTAGISEPEGAEANRLSPLDIELDSSAACRLSRQPEPGGARPLFGGVMNEGESRDLERRRVTANEDEIVGMVHFELRSASEGLAEKIAELTDQPCEIHLRRSSLRWIPPCQQRAGDPGAALDLRENHFTRLHDLRLVLVIVTEKLGFPDDGGERIIHRVRGSHREAMHGLETGNLSGRHARERAGNRDLARQLHESWIGTPPREP